MTLMLSTAVDAENTKPGDILLANGRMVFSYDLRLQVAQKLHIEFGFFKGEWFLDVTEGLPYFSDVLIKAPNPRTLRAIFSRTITDCPGVRALDSIAVTILPTRELDVVWSATLDDGRVLTSADFGPYRIPL